MNRHGHHALKLGAYYMPFFRFSRWTENQLLANASVYNQHSDALEAALVLIVHTPREGQTEFYLVTPSAFEKVAVSVARALYTKPKRKGEQRKLFRKEVSREKLSR